VTANPGPYMGAIKIDPSNEEAAALTKELHEIIENDRYPFSLSRSHLRCSPRIRTLRGILARSVRANTGCRSSWSARLEHERPAAA
jgi:hypothetical protein